MDKILMKDVAVFAYHGVFPEEKRDGQRFLLDLTLETDLSRAATSDRLEDTVNYAAVTEVACRVMTERSYNLIECAAVKVAEAILSAFSAVSAVTVRLKKPDAPVDVPFGYMAVEVTRCREADV